LHAESRRRWSQRVFFDWEDGNGLSCLAKRWKDEEPAQFRLAVTMIGLLGSAYLEHLWNLLDPAAQLSEIERTTSTSSGRIESHHGDRMAGHTFFEQGVDSPIA